MYQEPYFPSPHETMQQRWHLVESSPDSPTHVMDLPLRSTPSGTKRRRRPVHVSFAEEALMYPNDRTPEEVENSWYTKDDLAEFKLERRELVKMLKRMGFKIELVDQSVHCLRGFEAYFSIEVNKATKYARDSLFTVVFAEQNRQRALGIRDYETLRRTAAAATQWSLRNALELGAKDATDSYLINFQPKAIALPCGTESLKALLRQKVHKSHLNEEIRQYRMRVHPVYARRDV